MPMARVVLSSHEGVSHVMLAFMDRLVGGYSLAKTPSIYVTLEAKPVTSEKAETLLRTRGV